MPQQPTRDDDVGDDDEFETELERLIEADGVGLEIQEAGGLAVHSWVQIAQQQIRNLCTESVH
jgi:hypothetical protein